MAQQGTARTAGARSKKVYTNEDVQAPVSAVSEGSTAGANGTSAAGGAAAAGSGDETAVAGEADCGNADAERVNAELEATQEELDQVQRELAVSGPVISGGNLDKSNFKQGGSGLNVESAPLSQTRPEGEARIREVELRQKLASLKRAAQIACAPEKNVDGLRELFAAQKDLEWKKREYALDSDAYYAKPTSQQDAAGKAKLDAEEQEIRELEERIDGLKADSK